MVTDQEIAKGVETLLRQSDPNAVTSLNGVVQQLEAKLGLDLSHKAGFIRDQISFLLRSEPVPKDQFAPEIHTQYQNRSHPPQQFLDPHVVFQQQLHQQHNPSPHQPQAQPRPQPPRPPPLTVAKTGADAQNVVANASGTPKGSTTAGTKRRGGPGGLNKVCGVSPELQAIVGEPALPRTEIVKQLWAYIRKHNLQDPGNKRKIICDDALRLVFETDCTDMFKMNKLLAKHILALDPTKESAQAKKPKVEDSPEKESTESSPPPVIISDSLLKFFGTGEREMLQSVALGRVWEHIKDNQLEDPLNSTMIHCDAKLQELLGCKSISALGMHELIARRHLFKR
ncbi:alpha beta-gliadin A-V [Olea europaea subsp. europaea]|uniref:Alpha beta-gliadin A-V n=1 Tax=Olea europaea subsp. europaea TaxID=158383 RepID=A0A8S0SB39_OLEEU|nr:alpha beta-gliadin A-V [Olea europaea subsp. europaea]